MTHSLHRYGDAESLKKDFVVMTTVAVGYNQENAAQRLKEHFRTTAKYSPVNMGSHSTGNMLNTDSLERIIENVQGKSHTHNAVYTSAEQVEACLKELKEKELGLSVIISGVYEEVRSCCERAGLKPHTVNISLGIHGKTEKLPDKPTLEITTLCGHGLISRYMVEYVVEEIKAGRMSMADGARKIGEPCYCALFNVARTEEVLRKILKSAGSAPAAPEQQETA